MNCINLETAKCQRLFLMDMLLCLCLIIFRILFVYFVCVYKYIDEQWNNKIRNKRRKWEIKEENVRQWIVSIFSLQRKNKLSINFQIDQINIFFMNIYIIYKVLYIK